MNFRLLAFLLALPMAHAAEPDVKQDKTPFKDPDEKASYALGMNLGRSWKSQEIDSINVDLVAAGIRDAMAGKPLLTEQEAREAWMALNTKLTAKRNEKIKAEAEENRKKGEAFLAENKKKEGVITLPSGLQYKAVTTGTGPRPASNDTVRVHYRGTLIDGTEFDSSYKRGEPAKFGIAQVIKGWTEALYLMPIGSKWQLFIPSELAYGDQRRSNIPPGSTLLFDVELFGVEPPAQPAAGASSAKPAPAAPPK